MSWWPVWTRPPEGKPMRWMVLMIVLVAGAAMASDLDKRALNLDQKLMAPCCWTQTLNNHNSAIANDMRREIRQMLTDGKTDGEILNHFIAQYGKRILARPPAEGFNLAAYVLPALFLLAGAWMVQGVLQHWRLAKTTVRPKEFLKPIDDVYAERLARELREGKS